MNDDSTSSIPWSYPAPLPGTPGYVPGGRTGSPPSTPADPAHSLWREAFVVELRRLDVTGDRIGSALAEVNAHCADSGETPRQAFGEPAAYARALDLPRTARRGPDPLTLAATLCGLVGMLVWIKLSQHWGESALDVTVGELTALGLLGALGLLLALAPRRAENVVLRSPLLIPALAWGAFMGGAFLVASAFPSTAFTATWWALAATATALLALHVAHGLLAPTRGDPVRSPDGSSPREARAVSNIAQTWRWNGPWGLVAVTVAIVLPSYLLR